MRRATFARFLCALLALMPLLGGAAQAFTPMPKQEDGFAFFDGSTVFNPTSGTEMTLDKRILFWQGDAESLEIPARLGGVEMESIDAGAISGAESLRELTLPGSTMRVSAGAVRDCPNLERAIVYDDLELRGNPFVNCPALREIECRPREIYYGGSPFAEPPYGMRSPVTKRYGTREGCLCDMLWNTLLTPVIDDAGNCVVPEGIRNIGQMAFSGRSDLRSLALPEGVERIESDAFANCENLTEIALPDALETISASAFCNCESLERFSIPSSVRSIGDGAFEGCPRLTLSVEAGSYAQQWAEENGVAYALR